jgi:hypothetical protein
MGSRKNLQAYVDELNVTLQKTMVKKKQRRLKRRLKDNPWIYLTIVLVIALCIVAYWIVRTALLKK